MVGRTVSHYRVLERLGSGGMGVVYRAEDLRLARPVALKFLPAGLALDRHALERFQREARSASALNHPHICTIYDIDETDGQPFIAMELLEGETLKARLERGRLPIAEIVDLCQQLADALEAAHAHGIVHRDVKPANIFLTARGGAKLLDFGLAKTAAGPARAATGAPTAVSDWATDAGLTLGTVGYMSPEQVRGEVLDGRTDLFSLGVAIYEMATGVPPFRGATSGAVLGEILTKAPSSPVRLNPDVPPDLERLVNKLLEKDRALRYPSARDLRVDLERLRRAPGAAAHPEQASIVVLPFENLSPDPDNAFFADGLTEEIIADLSKVRALRVISRTSAMMFKGAKKGTPQIAQELNVRYVLEGSVRRAGNSLRITAQLIDAAADAHLWADKYSGTLQDVFDLQERLSRAIVDGLKVKLSSEEDRRIGERPIDNVQAYECYVKARQERYRLTASSLERALRLLENGLAIAGENVLLYAEMGNVYVQYVNSLIEPGQEYLRRAEECADRIDALDPAAACGYWLRGALAHKRGALQDAVRYHKRALAVDPKNADALYWLSYAYRVSGKEAAARPLVQRLVSIDPLTPYSYWAAAWIDFFEGHTGDALKSFVRMYELERESPFGRWGYAFALAASGFRDEALAVLDALVRDAPGSFHGRYGAFFRCALHDDRAGMQQAMASGLSEAARWDEHVCWMISTHYAGVGDTDTALEWLERAVQLGFVNYPFLQQRDPSSAPFRGEPRFQELMVRVRRAWERFQI